MFTVEEMDQIRKTYGIPYEEIQKGCGDVSISSIQKIFGGYVDRPRKATLEKLSKYFEMFLKENMSGKDDFKHLYERTVRDEYVAESNKFFSRGSSALDNPSGSYGEIFTQGGYTYEDYEKLQLPEGVRVEVIDGYIYTMDAPNVDHQNIVMYISNTFFQFIKENKGKCRVYSSPVDVRLEFDKDDMTVVQPDVLVICDREKKENKKNITGAPDFVLEVMSHSSRRMDMYVKMTKYKENGVREYWIVDYENDKIIKYDFENGDNITMYTFKDKVPVEIYDGKLVIDFKEIKEYVES